MATEPLRGVDIHRNHQRFHTEAWPLTADANTGAEVLIWETNQDLEPGRIAGESGRWIFCGLPYTILRDAILMHPTIAEGLNVLLATVPLNSGARPDT